MHTNLAAAGSPDPAILFGLLLFAGLLLVIAGLLVFSWWKRSLMAVVMACIVALTLGVMLQPWNLIVPVKTDDLDEAQSSVVEKFLAYVWAVLVVISTLASLVGMARHPNLKNWQIMPPKKYAVALLLGIFYFGVVLLPYLLALIPIVLAQTRRARIVASVIGGVSIACGIYFNRFTHNPNSDIAYQSVRYWVIGGFGIALVSVILTYLVDRKSGQKP